MVVALIFISQSVPIVVFIILPAFLASLPIPVVLIAFDYANLLVPFTPLGRQLLDRWGVVFRDMLAHETLAPPWRDLVIVLRRMEARGEVRGGRVLAGFLGEQFALPETLDLLRSVRRNAATIEVPELPAADPLNVSGYILPGPRVSALAGGLVQLA